MNYSYRDIYPTMGVIETSTEAIPVPEEQEALQEDVNSARETRPNYARGKNILIGIAVLVCAVVFLGGE